MQKTKKLRGLFPLNGEKGFRLPLSGKMVENRLLDVLEKWF